MKFRHFQLPGAVRAAVDSRIQPWHRYHGFLTIILSRYKADAAKYDPHPAPGVRIYHVEEDLRQVLQLNVETFYQYSNMMHFDGHSIRHSALYRSHRPIQGTLFGFVNPTAATRW